IFGQKAIESLAFLGTDQPDLHPTEQGLLRFTQNWPMVRFHRYFSKESASRCPAQSTRYLKLKDLSGLATPPYHLEVKVWVLELRCHHMNARKQQFDPCNSPPGLLRNQSVAARVWFSGRM